MVMAKSATKNPAGELAIQDSQLKRFSLLPVIFRVMCMRPMLARRVLERHPHWKVHALGGPHLREAGGTSIGDTSGCSVIGLVSSLQLVPRVLKLRRRVLDFFHRTHRCGCACDWGALTAACAATAREQNSRFVLLSAALVAAQRAARAWHRAVCVARGDAVRVVGPAFNRAGCRAEWVGHPLLETVQALPHDSPQRVDLRREFGAPDDAKLVALLPGSRAWRLRYIAPQIAGAVSLLRRDFQNLHFVAAVPRGAAASTRKKFPPRFQ
jgi:lipid-A-disaccharide synthase